MAGSARNFTVLGNRNGGLTVKVIAGPRVRALLGALTNLTPLMTRIGQYIIKAAQVSFANQRFGGTSWPARSLPSIGRIIRHLNENRFTTDDVDKGRPALVDTGALRRSFTARVLDGGKAVGVSSSVPYAALHQEGGASVATLTQAGRQNLKTLLGTFPALRPTLGFLFRRGAVSITVPKRQFLGVTAGMRAKIQELVRIYLKKV